MTEALSLAINFGFQERKLEKIVAITTTKNKKALQLLVRLNFEKEKEIKNESYWAIHQ
jgi:RimJ/RimL family protein N-acetyltransferase